MTKFNKNRTTCKDVFHAYMVENASYAGQYEFPVQVSSTAIPNKLISFSKARSTSNFNQWVHFYEDDAAFECIWNTPYKYLDLFKKFDGVILPDFSVYRDMPLSMQIWNIYRSRAVGNWLHTNGVRTIVNIRYGDERTYQICCDGIQTYSGIAIGTHGLIKVSEDRFYLLEGLDVVVNKIHPSYIVIYGSAPEKYFHKYTESGIKIYQFDSECAVAHRRIG